MTLPLSAFALFIGLMCVPFLALTPLKYGIFQQVESLIFGVWFLGGLASLWCFVAHQRRPALITKIFALPVVWLQVPFLAYVFVQALFISSPLLSFTGTPNLAQGGFTFLATLFLTPPLVLISKLKPLQKPIFWIAVGSCLLLSGLTILGGGDTPVPEWKNAEWCPIFFPDYIAYALVAIASLYWIFKDRFKRAGLYHAFFLTVLMLGAYYSRNLSIYVAIFLAFFTFVVVRYGPFQEVHPLKRFGFYLFSGLFIITVFISIYDVISPYLPEKLQDQVSLTSRLYLAKMTFIDFFYRPIDFDAVIDCLFGQGWGNFNNATLSHIFLVNEISLFSGSSWKPTWEFLDRDLLHSHNFILEAFLASGLVGVALFIYTKYRLIQALRAPYLFPGIFFLTSFFVVATFWFEMLHTLPFVLLATVFLFSAPASCKKRFSSAQQTSWTRMGSLFGCLLLPVSGLYLFFMFHIEGLKLEKGDDLIDKVESFVNSPYIAYDLAMGGYRASFLGKSLSHEMRSTLDALEKESNPEAHDEKTGMPFFVQEDDSDELPTKEEQIQSIVRVNTAIASQLMGGMRPETSLNALVIALNIFTNLSSHDEIFAEMRQKPQVLASWDKAAEAVHALMPFRTDILSVYFNYLLSTHQRAQLMKMVDATLQVNPQDSIAHWYKGLILLNAQSDVSQGLASLKKAIRLGVTRFLPIPQKEVDAILRAY